MADTEEILKAETVARDADAERAFVEGKQKLNQLSARFVDLKRRLARFESSNKQQKE
jgi:hypothetical protein